MPIALIVEDNKMNRKLLRDILEFKFEVEEAESAEAAIDLLDAVKPNIIFLDLQLPGMDGLAFARKLRKIPANVDLPIVAVSAHAMQENIDQALAAGCTEYVTKPITEDPFDFAERMALLVKEERE